MPELPEVERVVQQIRRFACGESIQRIEIIRGPNFFGGIAPTFHSPPLVMGAYRFGKHIILPLGLESGVDRQKYRGNSIFLRSHLAMTGFFDWQHDPWSFDYVEADRDIQNESDIRVKIHFTNAMILRYHDARLFGRMSLSHDLPADVGPELLKTECMHPPRPVISLREFAAGLWHSNKPIKQFLMEQKFVAGVGNIYANEGCHLAGIDPRWPACSVPASSVPILLEALRCVVLHSIPEIKYDWRKVYRRDFCGDCKNPVTRFEIANRATFLCENCLG